MNHETSFGKPEPGPAVELKIMYVKNLNWITRPSGMHSPYALGVAVSLTEAVKY